MAQWLTRGSMKAQRAGAAGKGRDGISGRDSTKAASEHQRPPRDCDGFDQSLRDCGGLAGRKDRDGLFRRFEWTQIASDGKITVLRGASPFPEPFH
jgi:hypothetical protein